VSATPPLGGAGSNPGMAERMGFTTGMVVQELGYDEDIDSDVRKAIEDCTGEEMVDEDSDEVVDVVVLWYRSDDGDLVDVLVDAIAPLADNGFIWLLTPKRGRPGHVEPSDISEAAPTAGLSQTSLASAGADWSAARLVARKSRTEKR
jgi:Protein of unknown function (DUF3052)